jgi:hypothetical protein
MQGCPLTFFLDAKKRFIQPSRKVDKFYKKRAYTFTSTIDYVIMKLV